LPPQVLLPPHGTNDETHDADQGGTDGPVVVYWGRYIGKPTMNGKLLGGFKHEFYFPFHIWDVILPIDELHHFSTWLLHHQSENDGEVW
jgi:hypothetical protein